MSERPPQPESDAPVSGFEVAPGVRLAPGVLEFRAVRSSGPGGQNVNKVSTKVELRVHAADLPLDPGATARLRELAGRRLTSAGELVIAADEYRSQSRNREECLRRLRELLVSAMARPKRRVKTKPTRGSQQRRIDAKKQRGDIKRSRSGDGHD